MQVWDLSKCALVFSDSIDTLKKELAKKEAGDYLIWDKDDKPAMDFVTACANIRSHIFGIQKKSLFDAKCKLYDDMILTKMINYIVTIVFSYCR